MAITARTHGYRLQTDTLTGVHWAAVGLATITGIVHLYLYWTQEFLPFLLAGLGFFGAVGLLMLNFHRRLLYAVGVPYTAAQMVAWYVQGMPEFQLGVFDKAVQALLIVLLVYLFVVEGRETVEPGAGIAETEAETTKPAAR